MTPSEFVTKYWNAAAAMQHEKGISALFALAQSALETGWGAHAPGNMMFGIKADSSWKGEKQYLTTTEVYNGQTVTVKAPFRKYPSAEASFKDWANFFYQNSRYKTALTVKSNPYRFAEEVAKAGYATAPGYAGALKKVIDVVEDIVKKKDLPTLPPEEPVS